MNANDSKAQSRRHLLALLSLVLLCTWPILRYGLSDWGNDGMHHSLETKEFARQFWDGDLYPRWLADFNGKLGSTSFFFVPTFSRFAVVWLEPLIGTWDPNGLYMTGIGAVLSFFLAAVACYWWCRSFATPDAALFGAVIYTVQPYHLAVNLYTRGAMGEMWGNIWPPLILLAQWRMIGGSRMAFPALALSYGCLVMNHMPTTLCFSVVPLFAAWFLSPAGKGWSVFVKTGLAMALGMGLAGGYLGPAMFDPKKAYLELMSEGMFQYHNLWLFRWDSLLQSQMRLMILTILTLVPTAICWWAARRRESDANRNLQLTLQGLMIVFAIFMSSQLSSPLYDIFKPLQMLQFPTRFLQVFVVPVAGIAALSWPYLRQPEGGWRGSLPRAAMSLFLLCTIAATLLGASKSFSVWRPFDTERQAMWALCMKIRPEIYQYLPRTTHVREIDTPQKIAEFMKVYPPRQMNLQGGGGETMAAPRVDSWKARKILLSVDSPAAGKLTIHHFAYPGWVGRRIDTGERIAVGADGVGLMQMQIPAGQYKLEMELTELGPEWWGETISMASFGLLGGITLLGLRRRSQA